MKNTLSPSINNGSHPTGPSRTTAAHFSARQYRVIAALITVLLWAFIFRVRPVDAFPATGWHRGDVSTAQENSREAIVEALYSPLPNIEVDVLDFIDEQGNRVGLLAHDYEMERITGEKGRFIEHHILSSLPMNRADPDLPPAPFMTVIDLFELIREVKSHGITPYVSLDMKEEGKTGREFGRWIGELITQYGFEEHVFASSFFKSNVVGVEESCPQCMTGGLVFNDHFALKRLNPRYTSLDLNPFSRMTFFLGFLGKGKFDHDFVLIQDDIAFSNPGLIDYWKEVRKVKFVGVFIYAKDRSYTEEEWQILEKADWLELDPPQMEQKLGLHGRQ